MSRLYIICFDISNDRRLRAVSKTLEDHGERVQYSVFECFLDDQDYRRLQQKMKDIIDPKTDHVRYYPICPKDQKGILLDGDSSLSTNKNYHLI